MIYNTHHFKPSSFIYGPWSVMRLLCLQIFTLPFFCAWNTCCISGTELGSGNSEIKASVSEAPRLVERRRREQLQGTIIVGGHSEGSPVAMEALRTSSPRVSRNPISELPRGCSHLSQDTSRGCPVTWSPQALLLTLAIRSVYFHLSFLIHSSSKKMIYFFELCLLDW